MRTKLMLIVTVVFLLLITLYWIGRKSVHAEIFIQASVEEVWNVLTDFEHVSEWNTILIPLEGQMKEGNTILYEFRQTKDQSTQMNAKIKQVVDYELLNQTGGIPGILTFNHKYILESVEESTRVTIHEEYRGIMVPFWNPKPVENAYQRLLGELKSRTEDSEK